MRTIDILCEILEHDIYISVVNDNQTIRLSASKKVGKDVLDKYERMLTDKMARPALAKAYLLKVDEMINKLRIKESSE